MLMKRSDEKMFLRLHDRTGEDGYDFSDHVVLRGDERCFFDNVIIKRGEESFFTAT
jgi:hypothetical protein